MGSSYSLDPSFPFSPRPYRKGLGTKLIADRTVFARELFARFSLVKISLPACTASESRALPLRWFQSSTTSGHPIPNSNRNLSRSVSLTAIYCSGQLGRSAITDEGTGRAESGSSCLYERPGYEDVSYLVWLCQRYKKRAEISISLRRQF